MTQAKTTDTTSRRRFLAAAAGAAIVPTAAVAASADAALEAAAAAVPEADRAMSALLDAHGDDAVDRSDYLASEKERYGHLEMLATVPAIGTAGLLAKARTLQVRSVMDDVYRSQEIALSLAEDLGGLLS